MNDTPSTTRSIEQKDPPQRDPPGPIRGPLKTEVSTSSPVLEAGTYFSLFVRLSNPFDVPVGILKVSTVVPVEFVDVEQQRREREKRKALDEAESFVRTTLQSAIKDHPIEKEKKEKLGALKSAAKN